MNNTCLKIAAVLLLACTFSGCGISATDANSSKDTAFSNGFYETDADRYSYLTDEGFLKLLDFETMHQALLCNKPNCSHTGDDCIIKRLHGIVPVFAGHSIYYFADDEADIISNEENVPELKLGTTLYQYDLQKNTEKKVAYIEGCAVSSAYGGVCLESGVLYFVGNSYSRYYDETGFLIGAGNAGGTCYLYAVNLGSAEVKQLQKLYNVEELEQYYPLAPNSGQVIMQGVSERKLYFNVGFAEDVPEYEDSIYRHYVTYYDLDDGSYYGTPEDYSNISFSAVRFCSEDYLVTCSSGKAEVLKQTDGKLITLEDECFDEWTNLTVFDDTLFCGEKTFDLKTGEMQIKPELDEKSVVAKYGDSYIISDLGMQSNFEKIPAEQLLK